MGIYTQDVDYPDVDVQVRENQGGFLYGPPNYSKPLAGALPGCAKRAKVLVNKIVVLWWLRLAAGSGQVGEVGWRRSVLDSTSPFLLVC